MQISSKIIFSIALILTSISSFSYCETADIDKLIGEYNSATVVQRFQVENSYRYKTMDANGVIKDVQDWNAFDERTDTSALYPVRESRRF